jgi:PhzF family phenazine biosynthesis protein
MTFPLFQVDAFTAEPFRGNPAAVCLLDRPQPAEWMQHVGAEMNLSETAFIERQADGFGLRWFTPVVEVPLCGHATLASAHVLWETGRAKPDEAIRFHTLSGVLTARKRGGRIELDFPAIAVEAIPLPGAVLEILGVTAHFAGQTPGRGERGRDLLLELESEEAVRDLRPDFQRLADTSWRGVIVTARATTAGFDFVSRFFAPLAGVNEDPVTGVAHCVLTPYWSKHLGKTEMVGYQASRRGGVVHVRLAGERVFLSGEAVTVLRGELLA